MCCPPGQAGKIEGTFGTTGKYRVSISGKILTHSINYEQFSNLALGGVDSHTMGQVAGRKKGKDGRVPLHVTSTCILTSVYVCRTLLICQR